MLLLQAKAFVLSHVLGKSEKEVTAEVGWLNALCACCAQLQTIAACICLTPANSSAAPSARYACERNTCGM